MSPCHGGLGIPLLYKLTSFLLNIHSHWSDKKDISVPHLCFCAHCLSPQQISISVRSNLIMANTASFIFIISQLMNSGEIPVTRMAFLRMLFWHQMVLCAEGNSFITLVYFFYKLIRRNIRLTLLGFQRSLMPWPRMRRSIK